MHQTTKDISHAGTYSSELPMLPHTIL